MKIKDYLESISTGLLEYNIITGDLLLILKPFLLQFDEFVNKKIEILLYNDYELISVANISNSQLADTVKIHSIHLNNDDVIVRISKDSLRVVKRIDKHIK